MDSSGPARKWDEEEKALASAGKTQNSPFLRGGLPKGGEGENRRKVKKPLGSPAGRVGQKQVQEEDIQHWIESVATGQVNVSTPEVFADVALELDARVPSAAAGAGEFVVRFDCSASDVGLSFYEQSLAVATVQPGSPAARNPNIKVGDSLVAVEGRSTIGVPYAEVTAMLRGAGNAIQLTFKQSDVRSVVDEGGPVLLEGDLLKIEPNVFGFITGDTSREAHVRYFVVRADHVTYIRSIGSEVVLPFSLIHDINASDRPDGMSIADLAFSSGPSEPLALLTITMNGKYRKPFRVYMLQAPSIAARDHWVRVCQQAKREHTSFGPWRTRRNYDASSIKRGLVSRTRRVEGGGMFERDYTLYIIETENCGGQTFQIERRYSDFVNFHERWLEKVMSPYSPLPELSRLEAISDKNDPMIVIHRMALLGGYIGAALTLAARLGSRLVTAALQHFLQAGSSQNGDCEGAGCGAELDEGWDELSVACTGDDAGATYEILHSTFDPVGRWTFRAEGPDGLPDWSLYSLTCKVDGVAVFAAQGHPDARGRGVFAVGHWSSLDDGRRLQLEFETATDTTVPPSPAIVDQVAAGGRFAVVVRKVCATQVFSVAGTCDCSNSGEFLAYALDITGKCSGRGSNVATWTVNRRFTEFDELRKRLEAEYPSVMALNEFFPSKYTVNAGVELFSKETQTEGKVARKLNLALWIQKVAACVPLHPGLLAFCQPQPDSGLDSENVVESAVAIASVELRDAVKQNAGISWGVDDLDRRRYLVVERCVVGGQQYVEGATIPLRVQNGRVLSDALKGSLYHFPPRLAIFWDDEAT